MQGYVFGTFDMLHLGHRYFLSRARKLADPLTAIVTRDATAFKLKGRMPSQNEQTRLKAASGLCHNALLSDKKLGVYSMLRPGLPATVILGADQTALFEDLWSFIKKRQISCQVVFVPPWQRDTFSTTRLRETTL